MIVNIIVAYCKNRGLGKNNTLLWDIKSDMAKFKKLTSGDGNNAIIMGRKTFESLNNSKGLVARDNLILSKSLILDNYNDKNCVKTFTTLELLEEFVKTKNYSQIWIIGGAEIYKQLLPIADKVYMTEVLGDIEGDTYLEGFNPEEWELANISEVLEENGFSFIFKEYIKKVA